MERKRINRMLTFTIGILCFASWAAIAVGSSRVYAAKEVGINLAVTNYDKPQDFNVLLAGSKRVLAYYSGQEVQRPVMLHLISDEQQQALEGKGFAPRIIEKDPDMTRYRLFYLVIPTEGDKLQTMGSVYGLAKSYALVRLSDSNTLGQNTQSLKVMPAPFLDLVVSTDGKNQVQVSPIGKSQEKSTLLGKKTLLGIIGLLVLVVAAGIGFFIYRRRQQGSALESETTPPPFEPPLPPGQNTLQ